MRDLVFSAMNPGNPETLARPVEFAVKTFFDTEARVIGVTAGKGRHVGAVGALECVIDENITLTAGKKTCTLKGGTRFEVGSGLDDS